jgi:hypothetical protein
MRRKVLTICEMCGGTEPSGAADFFLFHCLTFCSPDCLHDYRSADEERRASKERAHAGLVKTTARSRAA